MANLIQLMTDEDVMEYLGITDKRTLREYLKGGLQYIKIGRKRKFTSDDVNNFIQKRSTTLLQ